MPSPISTIRSSKRISGRHSAVLISVVAALVYAGGHLLWYLGTPLGQVPVLDEQENITFATSIFTGNLPAEPFYRAPGYALLLIAMRWLGISSTGLFPAALALGVVLHAINAGLIARITGRLFGVSAAFIGGLLAAFYPVLIHFSTQALDAVPSLTFFLVGLDCLIQEPDLKPQPWHWVGASFGWAAATLMRPNFFSIWLMLPVLAAITPGTQIRFRRITASLLGGLLLLVAGGWQWRVAGVAGFLPWQGSYNLWAANQPEGHGRYYVQKHALPAVLARQNPARIESILFYQEATSRTDADIPTMNAYWRNRFLTEVGSQPLQWLGLLARKTYAFCNDWEQYNNKTYAFHRARSPWLFWNPLSFGVIFVLGIAGAFRLAKEDQTNFLQLAVISAAYSASVILFYVSDRFRLPVAALAIIFSAGTLSSPVFWRAWSKSRQLLLAVSVTAAALLTFSNFDSVRSRATFVQDHALLARAADTVGDDHLAWDEALGALSMQAQHPDAMRIAITAYFNQLLDENAPSSKEADWLAISRRFLASPAQTGNPGDLRAVAALALWRSGDRAAALAEWRSQPSNASATAARVLIDDNTVSPQAVVDFTPDAWRQPLVQLAAGRRGIRPPPGSSSQGFPNPAALAARLFISTTSP